MATQVFRVETRGGDWANLVAHIDGVIRPVTSDGGECRPIIPCDIAAAKQFIADQDAKLTLQRKTTRQGGRRPNPVADMIFALPTETHTTELSPEDLDKWSHGCVDWVKKRFPASHIVNANLHLDEATPHMHVMIVPVGHHNGRWGWSATFKDAIQDITGDQVKNHPKRGELSKLMSRMQDDMWEHCGKPFRLERGKKGANKYRDQIDRQIGLQKQREKAERREVQIRKEVEQLQELRDSVRRDQKLLEKQNAEREKKERQLREAADALGKWLVAVLFFMQEYYERKSKEATVADVFMLVFEVVKEILGPKRTLPRLRAVAVPDNVPKEPYINIAVLEKKRRLRDDVAAELADQLQAWWETGGADLASELAEEAEWMNLDPDPVETEDPEPSAPTPEPDAFDEGLDRVLKTLHTHPSKREEPTPSHKREPDVEPVDEEEPDDHELLRWRDNQIKAGRMTAALFDEWVKNEAAAADDRDEKYKKWLAEFARTPLRGASDELRKLVVEQARPIAKELGLYQTRTRGDRTRSKQRAAKAKESSQRDPEQPSDTPDRTI